MSFLKSASVAFVLCFLAMSSAWMTLDAQIVYNWQNSKEGWVSAGETNLGCTLTATPEAMAMRSFNQTPVMRSGSLQSSLGVDASEYNQVEISLRNPTASANPNARLFVYPPGSNDAMCHFNFQVDTSMTEYATYTLDLEAAPTSGVYTGEVGRFGLRAPWGVANGDTIWWESMVVSNTNIDTTTLDVHMRDMALEVYPNPASDVLEINATEAIGTVWLRDGLGRTVLVESPKVQSFRLDVSSLPNRVYVLSVEVGGAWQQRRVVVGRD